MNIKGKNINVLFHRDTLQIEVQTASTTWKMEQEPYIETTQGIFYFHQAKNIQHNSYQTGLGTGISSIYKDFSNLTLEFETKIWIDSADELHMEWIILKEDEAVKQVYWPMPFSFQEDSKQWYTVVNRLQGLLIPNDWPVDITSTIFDGQLCSAASYMPWFGQVKEQKGYIAINETPWDAAYTLLHNANEKETTIGYRWLTSLGQMRYPRKVLFSFYEQADYVTLCKRYRNYVKEHGTFTSLKEKNAKNPLVSKLIGSAFVHTGIKTYVSPDSSFYDAEHPEKNNSLFTFDQRVEEIEQYAEMGIQKLYLHLDGWAEPGYDNQHPDYLPACHKAGGWEGLKRLSDAMQKHNYMLGLHDQYRDYYFKAPTFDLEQAILLQDGTHPEHSRWAGGHQTYLCTSLAPKYVKRNFTEILSHDIHLEGSYLDVFTCNELDECFHKEHPMTRKECSEYRNRCFDYLMSKNILPSSEEVNDWAIPSLVFSHYAPYEFMLQRPGSERFGIGVPLWNLVYHDCLVTPWPMEQMEQEDYMLYALLNGGTAYLERRGAYPNTDGAFGDSSFDLQEALKRTNIVTNLHEQIAMCEMLSHRFLSSDYKIQETVFSDGTTVTVDFHNQTYTIQKTETK